MSLLMADTEPPIPDAALRLAARQPDGRRPQIMHQRWESLLFLHWQVPVERLQSTLPSGLTIDTCNGQAYLGIAPFFMRNVRPIGLPAVPWISNFQELNVRTYVYDQAGIPGVWFYSLDCNQPLAVMVARTLTGLKYRHAQMSAQCDGFIDYACQRNGCSDAARFRYRGVGEARESDPPMLEFFLLERYYLYAERAGSLVRGQVSHEPYRFRAAEVEIASSIPAQWDGFTEVSGDPVHAVYVDGVDVKIYATEKVG